MTVVIDANLVAALILPLPYSDLATEQMARWKRSGEQVYAPNLLEYDLASVFGKAVASGWVSTDDAAGALRDI